MLLSETIDDATKTRVVHDENKAQHQAPSEELEFLNNLPEHVKKQAVRKVDLRLMPMLALLYLVAYLDKTNIANAKIEGMIADLGMDGVQYNIAVSVFFITFVLAEVPSNMILHVFARPSLYIGAIVLSWGVIMTLTGIVKNFAGLVAIRIFLGLFEAGFLPGAILIISKWYLPNETQTRIAILYTSAATGGAFSGLLAFAIAKLDGVAGLEGWRWIFILEGIFTVMIGIACFFLLLDTPARCTAWLSPDQIRYLELRQNMQRLLNHNDYHPARNSEDKHFDKRSILSVITDWKIYLLIFANWSNAVPNYAMKFAMPQVIKGMGYTSANAQLLTIPPYLIGAISAFVFSFFADRITWRAPFILVPQTCLIVAFAILFSKSADVTRNVPLCYFGICLACFGMYPILPGVNAWNVANTPSPKKRAVSIGFLICIGNIGGLIGSYIYLDSEAPSYPTGYGTSFGFAAAGIVAVVVLEMSLKRLNGKKEQLSEEEIRQRFSDVELDEMGEKSPLFRYAL